MNLPKESARRWGGFVSWKLKQRLFVESTGKERQRDHDKIRSREFVVLSGRNFNQRLVDDIFEGIFCCPENFFPF
jgi:hypothetical protein